MIFPNQNNLLILRLYQPEVILNESVDYKSRNYCLEIGTDTTLYEKNMKSPTYIDIPPLIIQCIIYLFHKVMEI